ncbi:hypothetical protein FGD67_17530 [Colwellia sp. M166]|uniref:hypothetical protein n=1 Tax=Colwellia sp. M166 TaxID=2583805 RepID=UPI00211F06FC|nr:hypothetical protein [Colwellia sp. M166]UUO24818.1 hypothetical protein FGD67_17530 [Colwellia sp. M166]
MEYIFIFTYTVIVAVVVGLILATIVALFSQQNKRKYFQRTFGYTTLAVSVFILLLIFVKLLSTN